MTGVLVIAGAGLLIAFMNGANDVSKGIATLVGSGVTDYRRALHWGTLCTALGALAAANLTSALVTTFGNGLLAPGVTPTFTATLATLFGAAAWVLFATRTGLPVSTTHAIVGAIAGVGGVAYGLHGINWTAIGAKVAVPLLLSPIVSLVMTVLVLRLVRARASEIVTSADCLCVEVEAEPELVGTAGTAVLLGAEAHVSVGSQALCAEERPAALRVTLDHAHWLTSGATSFARGLNDAPKMVALMLAASALSGQAAADAPLMFSLVTLGMVAGSLLAGRRVTHVLAEKVTRMDHRGGFAANLVTASLVGAGALAGWPMSTTHVSSGAIMASGAGRGTTNWRTVHEFLLAWIVTVPAAATLGIAIFMLFGGVRA